MLELVGIDPSKVPAKRPAVAAKHVDLLVRFIGYREGLRVAKNVRLNHDLEKDVPSILGDFIFNEITMKPTRFNEKSIFSGMTRMLAITEGATGYAMTSEKCERKAFGSFLKAIINDIRSIKQAPCTQDQATIGEQLPLQLEPSARSM